MFKGGCFMKNDKKPVAQNYVYKDNPDKKFTKKCAYCKQVIDKKASICPFCKRQQPIGCLTLLLAMVIVAILLFVAFIIIFEMSNG